MRSASQKSQRAAWIDRERLPRASIDGDCAFWATGHCVSTVGLDATRMWQSIREEKARERRQDEFDFASPLRPRLCLHTIIPGRSNRMVPNPRGPSRSGFRFDETEPQGGTGRQAPGVCTERKSVPRRLVPPTSRPPRGHLEQERLERGNGFSIGLRSRLYAVKGTQ